MSAAAASDGGRRALRVAVLDSGITAGHPHVGEVAAGAAFRVEPTGGVTRSQDSADRIGHGTACAGVIRELLPRAELLAGRIFDRRLRADQRALAAAIEWALEEGAVLINLSLAASLRGAGGRALLAALRAAGRAGAAVVAARPPASAGPRWGGLEVRQEVIACGVDPRCPRESFREDPEHPGAFLTFPHARPIPGVPLERNFSGPSLAAARLTGFAGRIIQALGPLPADRLRGLLVLRARESPGRDILGSPR